MGICQDTKPSQRVERKQKPSTRKPSGPRLPKARTMTRKGSTHYRTLPFNPGDRDPPPSVSFIDELFADVVNGGSGLIGPEGIQKLCRIMGLDMEKDVSVAIGNK